MSMIRHIFGFRLEKPLSRGIKERVIAIHYIHKATWKPRLLAVISHCLIGRWLIPYDTLGPFSAHFLVDLSLEILILKYLINIVNIVNPIEEAWGFRLLSNMPPGHYILGVAIGSSWFCQVLRDMVFLLSGSLTLSGHEVNVLLVLVHGHSTIRHLTVSLHFLSVAAYGFLKVSLWGPTTYACCNWKMVIVVCVILL